MKPKIYWVKIQGDVVSASGDRIQTKHSGHFIFYVYVSP